MAAVFLLAGPASFAQDKATRKAEKQARKEAKAAQKLAQKAQEDAAEAQDSAEEAAREAQEIQTSVQLALQNEAKAAQEDAVEAQKIQTSMQLLALQKELGKLKDFDKIVITRKNSDKHDKVTIEIKGDSVIVNGEPIEKFTDDALSVRIEKPLRYTFVAPRSPFQAPGSAWSLENGNRMGRGNFLSQPYLGIFTQPADGGVKIVNIVQNSAAAKAGLQKEDIITKVNGRAVTSHEQLTSIIAALKPKDKVDITYKRNGKENSTTAVLGEKRETITFRRSYGNPGEVPELPEAPEAPELGIVPSIPPIHFNFDGLEDGFNWNNRPRIGIKAQDTEDGKGVKVLDVDDDSPAEKSGIKEGDIITTFDGKDVNSAAELADASKASKDKASVKVQLKRNGKTENIDLKVPKKLKTANL